MDPSRSRSSSPRRRRTSAAQAGTPASASRSAACRDAHVPGDGRDAGLVQGPQGFQQPHAGHHVRAARAPAAGRPPARRAGGRWPGRCGSVPSSTESQVPVGASSLPEGRVGPQEALALGGQQALVPAGGEGAGAVQVGDGGAGALDAVHHQVDAPPAAGRAQPGQVQLQAVLEPHPGDRQDPGPGPQGVDEPGFRLVRGGRAGWCPMPAAPARCPSHRGTSRNRTLRLVQGLPGVDIAGELPQRHHHLVPGAPGKPLGHRRPARRRCWGSG